MINKPNNKGESQKKCPQCNSYLPPNSSICTICKTDSKTGNKAGGSSSPLLPQKKRSRAKHILLAITLTLSVFSAFYMYYEPIVIVIKHSIPRTMTLDIPARLNRSYFPLWMKRANNDQVQTAFTITIKSDLRKIYPIHRIDDVITVQERNGKSHSGQFLGIQNGYVTLYSPNPLNTAIPLKNLTKKHRLRCDPQSRQNYIEKKARAKTVAFLLGSSHDQNR